MLRPEAVSQELGAPLEQLRRDGYARLGRVLSDTGARRLRTRADDLMLGRVAYPGLFFQHDSKTGRYEDLERGLGWIGPSLSYRKVEKLELDPLFFGFIENPLFARIAANVLGAEVTLYRAVLWNKAPHGGVDLPWHQDDGRFWGIDRSPTLQIWTALDDAPAEAGCVEVVRGSHRDGLATPEGGTVPETRFDDSRQEARTLLPARAGESLLLHNHVWHRSGRNATDHPRRALGIAYLTAATRCTRRRRPPRVFTPVFTAERERTPSARPTQAPRGASLCERLGGPAGLDAIVRAFFAEMERRPEASGIRALRAPDVEPMIAKLSRLLTSWADEPERRARASVVPMAHFAFPIGATEVETWLSCMRAALQHVGAEARAAESLMDLLAPIGTLCRSDGEAGPF